MRLFAFAIFILFLPFTALAQEDGAGALAVPQSQQQITLTFAPVVRQAAPAVVNIYAARVVSQRVSPFMNDPFFEQLFGGDLPGMGVPRNRVEQALGSGVIVRADGVVVTNRHVIQDAREIKVILNDRREFPAEVVLLDEKTDLAVLRIDGGAGLPTLPLGDSDALEVGDLVLAIGNPFGVGQTVTSGIVSATARAAAGITDYSYFIQTDAAINPGNSGGALVDMGGNLVGINTAIYSRTGGSLGIGFAIPVNMVRTVIEAGAAGQRLVRPWLGISTEPVTAEIAASLGMARPQGVLVKTLQPASPLRAAGIRSGDIITAVDGQAVDTPEALTFRVGTQAVGSEVAFSVKRRDTVQVYDVVLAAAPETPPREAAIIKGSSTPFSGASVANISPAVLDELGLENAPDTGVIVTDVTRRSMAARIGLQVGDVPLQVNGRTITKTADLTEAVRGQPRLWRLKLQRGGQIINTVLGN